MFSEPHRRGDSLAWIEATFVTPDRPPVHRGLYEVWKIAPGEPWEAAFVRAEARVAAELAPELRAARRSTRLAFERHRSVLTERGLVPPREVDPAADP